MLSRKVELYIYLMQIYKSAVSFISYPLTSEDNNMCSNTAVQRIWRQADAVCFDIDSTVIQEEGMDELAKFCNKGDEVINLTKKAMTGKMTFEESLRMRLDIIRPSITQLRDFVRTKPPTLTPGIKKLIELLHDNHIPVYLISGGFKTIITPIAIQLNVPLENIFANRLKFYYTGEYAGFDESAPTSRSGGKAVVIDMLKKQHGYNKLVLIGDGMTDLEACPPSDAFIGYGGNVIREEVKAKSHWFVTDFNELIELYNQ